MMTGGLLCNHVPLTLLGTSDDGLGDDQMAGIMYWGVCQGEHGSGYSGMREPTKKKKKRGKMKVKVKTLKCYPERNVPRAEYPERNKPASTPQPNKAYTKPAVCPPHDWEKSLKCVGFNDFVTEYPW